MAICRVEYLLAWDREDCCVSAERWVVMAGEFGDGDEGMVLRVEMVLEMMLTKAPGRFVRIGFEFNPVTR